MSAQSTQRIEDEAGLWLIRRDAGEWSPENEAQFTAWMDQSMLHRVAYWRLEETWHKAQRLKALATSAQFVDAPPRGRWNFSPFFSRGSGASHPPKISAVRAAGVRRALYSAAVCLAVAAVVLTIAPGRFAAKSFETTVGGVSSVPMSDGSKVTLNTDSAIKVRMRSTERRIDLEHGEAFFEVAKDPGRPFIVSAGRQQVIAVGTKFSVRTDAKSPDDIRVVVTEGSVRIVSVRSTRDGGPEPPTLAAGTVALMTNEGLVVERKPPGEAEEELSWRSGVIVFRDVTLAEAAAEFNRYNERKLVIEDPATAKLRVAGSFRTTGVEPFVDIIERGYPVRVRMQSEKILIGSSP